MVLDLKLNKQYNLHEVMLNFLTMRQGQQGSDDSSTKCFNAKLYTLDTVVGRYIVCSNEIMEKVGYDTTDKEVKKEV